MCLVDVWLIDFVPRLGQLKGHEQAVAISVDMIFIFLLSPGYRFESSSVALRLLLVDVFSRFVVSS